MKKTAYLFTLLTTVLFFNCSEEENLTNIPTPVTPTTPTQTVKEKIVKLSDNATFGKILTDGEGKTLYFLGKDTKGKATCTDGCLSFWPSFYTKNITNLGNGLNSSDFSTITGADGKKQTAYKGWPLYYHVNDKKAGDVTGDAKQKVWFVAKPDYSLMYAGAQLVGKDGKKYKSDYTEGEGLTLYITSAKGRTIYAFSKDKKDTNTFTKADFSNNAIWPIINFNLEKLPSVLKKSDFGTITVHGKTQMTYRGWPLYYYAADTNRGDTKGISIPKPGIWPIVNGKTTPAPSSL